MQPTTYLFGGCISDCKNCKEKIFRPGFPGRTAEPELSYRYSAIKTFVTGEINVFIRRLELVGCREPAVKLSAGYGQMDPVGRENGAMPCRQDKIPKHRADRYFGVTSEETAKPLKCKTDCFFGQSVLLLECRPESDRKFFGIWYHLFR